MIETVFTSKTLMGLISDTNSFESITNDYFHTLDLDKDGFLSPSELRQGLNRVVAVESEVASGQETDDVYNAIFDKFGENLVPEKFRELMAEILTAMARAFGNTPVIMVVHDDGLIMKAVQHELNQVQICSTVDSPKLSQKNIDIGNQRNIVRGNERRRLAKLREFLSCHCGHENP